MQKCVIFLRYVYVGTHNVAGHHGINYLDLLPIVFSRDIGIFRVWEDDDGLTHTQHMANIWR
jgi:hypothetical protein